MVGTVPLKDLPGLRLPARLPIQVRHILLRPGDGRGPFPAAALVPNLQGILEAAEIRPLALLISLLIFYIILFFC